MNGQEDFLEQHSTGNERQFSTKKQQRLIQQFLCNVRPLEFNLPGLEIRAFHGSSHVSGSGYLEK